MLKKAIAAIAAALLIIMFAGCSGQIDVSKLVDKPIPYVPPAYQDYSQKIYPTEYHPDYEDAYIVVDPVMGQRIRLADMEFLVQEIIDSVFNKNLLVGVDIKTRFKNKLTIYSSSDIELLSLSFAADDSLYARAGNDGPIFRMPQYIYYTIESLLWQTGGSLEEPLKKWTPLDTTLEEDELPEGAGNAPLELQLPHDIKTMLVSIYGKYDSYFINFEIYSTAVDEQSVRVYLMASYACYDIDEKGEYKPIIRDATPIKLVYTWVEGEMWRITEFDFPRNYNIKEVQKEADIRYIMPYDDTQRAISVLKDTDDMFLDLYRQALDYLRETGRGDLTVAK